MHGKRKLNELVKLYESGAHTGVALAKIYGLSVSYTYKVLQGRVKGVAGSRLRPSLFILGKTYQQRGDTVFRLCCRCKEWKEFSTENWYVDKRGITKYGRCKCCHMEAMRE
jgi:hypothetical protein